MVNLDRTNIENISHQAIDRFWEVIPPVWDRIQRNIRTIAADQFEITVKQYQILRHIQKGKGSVSELATVKQISRSAASQVVELLVNKGLVNRRQNENNRRCHELDLTERGINLLNEIDKKNRRWMMEQMAALSTNEVSMVLGGFEVLKRTFIQGA
jgi:DNA-binding MarR family transcriptional regulator